MPHVMRALKRLAFTPLTKHPRFQPFLSRLHTLALFGMNYGGGAALVTSGETWFLHHTAQKILDASDAPVVFDVGAHVGDYSLLVRRAVPSARIYAFEPASDTFRYLERNLAISGARDITAVNAGFSDAEGTAELHTYTANGQPAPQLSSIPIRRPTQVVDVRAASAERVRVTTVDMFCRSRDITRIGLLKLDVEGHELAVLRGAERMLAENAVLMIQFEFGPANIYSRTFFYDFWSLLCGRFDLFRMIPRGLVPVRDYGEHREVFLTTNYVAIAREAPAR